MVRNLVISTVVLFTAVPYTFANNKIEQIHAIKSENQSMPHEEDRYTVLIYGEPKVFNEHRLGSEVKRLEEKFNLPVLSFKASSVDKFHKILISLTKGKISIQNLFVRGIHGYNFLGEPNLEVFEHDSHDFAATSFTELEELGIQLNFTPSAFIFFDSCDLIDSVDEETIKNNFQQLRRIGFKTGWIYLNDSEGSTFFEQIHKVPFWKSYGGFKDKLRHFALQVVGWPVFAPAHYAADRFMFNFGYLYGASDSYELLLNTHATKVINGNYNNAK